ncbi:MAG: hypothetical protein K2G03_01805 [Bacilli bacterium]|nr:hypothetical protein [Bacilli bacterium]
MTINEFEEILKELKFDYSRGISNDEQVDEPRLIFWDYVWEDISSSGEVYNTLVTYQISNFSIDSPRENTKLINLKNKLARYDIRPIIYHEYVETSRIWHSYFSIEILENV